MTRRIFIRIVFAIFFSLPSRIPAAPAVPFVVSYLSSTVRFVRFQSRFSARRLTVVVFIVTINISLCNIIIESRFIEIKYCAFCHHCHDTVRIQYTRRSVAVRRCLVFIIQYYCGRFVLFFFTFPSLQYMLPILLTNKFVRRSQDTPIFRSENK